jgi:hypothetical protein
VFVTIVTVPYASPGSECLILLDWLAIAPILPLVYSCLCGAFGGMVSHVLARRRQAKDEIDGVTTPALEGWQHGLSGDLIIGAAVGLATYLLGANDVPLHKIYGIALLGGVSGGKYFNRDDEVKEARRTAKNERAKSKILKKTTSKVLQPPVKGEEINEEHSEQ